MSNVKVLQQCEFKRAYKKLHKNQKVVVDKAIDNLVKNPHMGIEKNGDLSGLYVYKLNILKQEYLLAYEFDPKTRILVTLGVHENFYRDLKRKRLH
jgi:mRNA interferase RelE/StbE